MCLFNTGYFVLSGGEESSFKIDCDDLTKSDIEALAQVTSRLMSWEEVESVPTGGDRFAKALSEYCVAGGGLLIADDVLTTGNSMERVRADRVAKGVVLFARRPPPEWIVPLFLMRQT